ncbi:hypothetical protein N9Z27_01800 [Alphaproteobacteria bacterium]|nr:hypothetical protein [Alphaproteobacteria bacterium]
MKKFVKITEFGLIIVLFSALALVSVLAIHFSNYICNPDWALQWTEDMLVYCNQDAVFSRILSKTILGNFIKAGIILLSVIAIYAFYVKKKKIAYPIVLVSLFSMTTFLIGIVALELPKFGTHFSNVADQMIQDLEADKL